MTIQMLVSIAGVGFALSAGELTDRFSAKEEQDLVTAGHAARVPASKVEKAVKPSARETR